MDDIRSALSAHPVIKWVLIVGGGVLLLALGIKYWQSKQTGAAASGTASGASGQPSSSFFEEVISEGGGSGGGSAPSGGPVPISPVSGGASGLPVGGGGVLPGHGTPPGRMPPSPVPGRRPPPRPAPGGRPRSGGGGGGLGARVGALARGAVGSHPAQHHSRSVQHHAF